MSTPESLNNKMEGSVYEGVNPIIDLSRNELPEFQLQGLAHRDNADKIIEGEHTKCFDLESKIFKNKDTEEWGNKLEGINESDDLLQKTDKKILAPNMNETDLSEYSDAKIKHMHISYRDKNVLEEVTRRFFSLNWYLESIEKYRLGIYYSK